ncbi:hypothetical protein [Pseudomonas sp. efr-133-TYG-23]|uniref:hypothetical protein n=1 Tax=Pseudomonas sp. efr-133-TYG-23 TaxID=3040309 RepID=UPI0025542F19|nr:hypothetical protein [Pseudomonas sp. efr-133-TYG-23]
MDFAKAYRACRRSQALGKSLKAVKACLGREGADYIKVVDASVDVFWPILGYRVTTLDGTAFFPRDISEIPRGGGLAWMREFFFSADIVIPPYYKMGFLSRHAIRIKDAPLHVDKMKCGDLMLLEMYPPDGLAQLINGVWSERRTFGQFHSQLVESSKAYCLGLYNVAIVGLLPCIEGIVRRLGVASGINVDEAVSIALLTKVFRRLQQKEIDMMMDGYDWYPANEINVSLLDHFHERVQMFESISRYLNSKLYLYTGAAPEYLTLNRHGISHGFFHGYATPENYLRLFNLLSALSFAAAMVEGKGSLMHPGATPESEALTACLLKCADLNHLIR